MLPEDKTLFLSKQLNAIDRTQPLICECLNTHKANHIFIAAGIYVMSTLWVSLFEFDFYIYWKFVIKISKYILD